MMEEEKNTVESSLAKFLEQFYCCWTWRLSAFACPLAPVARQNERHTVDGPGINNLAVDWLLPVEAGTFCTFLTPS